MTESQLEKYIKTFHEMLAKITSYTNSNNRENAFFEGKRGKKYTIQMCLQFNIFGEADVLFYVEGLGLFNEVSILPLLAKKRKNTKTRNVA